MDFTPSPGSEDAAALARTILTDRCTPERLAAAESDGDRFDADLWRTLGEAGLLGLHVGEDAGGAGLGPAETARVLTEAGRVVAPLPLVTHLAASAFLADGPFWPEGAVDGSTLLTVALSEEWEPAPVRPQTAAAPVGDGYRITGVKQVVAAGTRADWILVPATVRDAGSTTSETETTQETVRTGVFAVRRDQPGVRIESQWTSEGDEVALLRLDGVEVPADRAVTGTSTDANPDPDPDPARRLRHLVQVFRCAYQLGLTQGALRATSAYAGEREQFGRPIGTFQAVGQRLADGFIDTLGQELTLAQALWQVQEGDDPRTVEAAVATAVLWAAEAGHRIGHTTVHVHGGVGIDVDGTAHRYFTATSRYGLSYGGALEAARTVGGTFV